MDYRYNFSHMGDMEAMTNACFEDRYTSMSSTFGIVWYFNREAGLSQYRSMQHTVQDLTILQRLQVQGIP